MDHETNSKRHCAGCYRVTYRGRNFEARSMAYHTEGASNETVWILFDADAQGRAEDGYCNHFATKADALDAVVGCVEEERAEGITRVCSHYGQCGDENTCTNNKA